MLFEIFHLIVQILLSFVNSLPFLSYIDSLAETRSSPVSCISVDRIRLLPEGNDVYNFPANLIFQFFQSLLILLQLCFADAVKSWTSLHSKADGALMHWTQRHSRTPESFIDVGYRTDNKTWCQVHQPHDVVLMFIHTVAQWSSLLIWRILFTAGPEVGIRAVDVDGCWAVTNIVLGLMHLKFRAEPHWLRWDRSDSAYLAS